MRQKSIFWQDYAVVVMGSIVYTLLTFSWFSLPAYLPRIVDDVALSSTEAGILAGAIPLTYIPLALFSGMVVDRIGPNRSLGIALGFIGTAQILRSVSPDFFHCLVRQSRLELVQR